MKRALLMIIGSMLAVVPFALGMVGNTTLTRQVPVRVPAQAKTVEHRAEPTTKATPEAIKPTERITAEPVPTPSETKRGQEAGDDRGTSESGRHGRGRGSDDDSSGRDDSSGKDDSSGRGSGSGSGSGSGKSGSGHGGHDD